MAYLTRSILASVLISLLACTSTHAKEGSGTKASATKGSGAKPAVTQAEPAKPILLFNGKNLDGWNYYLGRKAKAKLADVWSVEDGILKCKGKPAGYIYTKEEFADYTLDVEWRWPAKGGNNGVLVHLSKAADEKKRLADAPHQQHVIGVWPRSLEVQLAAHNAGDFWVIGTEIDVPNEEKRVQGRRHLNLTNDSEKKLGEWNHMLITCKGAEVTVRVNDTLVNHGTNSTVTKGAIALQSEGTPIEYRKVVLRKL